MSFFSKIGKIAQKAIGYVAPLTGLIPGVGGAIASGIAGAIGPPQRSAPPTTAGAGAGGIAQTLPTLGGIQTGGGIGGSPTPGGLMRQLGAAAGAFAQGGIPGLTRAMGVPGARGATRMKTGRLTGNMIPAGYVEKMSSSGVIYLAKQRRRRGISARDLSSFYRVNRLATKIHARAHRAPGRKRG